MYKVTVPFKNYDGKPGRADLSFMMEVRDFMRNLENLAYVSNFIEDRRREKDKDIDPLDMVEFYTKFEEVILSAYGEITDDGNGFSRDARWVFERSKAFSELMNLFLADVNEMAKLLDGIVPDGMDKILEKQAASLKAIEDNPETSSELQAEVARLRAQLMEKEGGAVATTES